MIVEDVASQISVVFGLQYNLKINFWGLCFPGIVQRHYTAEVG